MSGDEFYCFGGFTNEGRLPRDGLNVLHFGLNNVVTWSNMKEAAPLGLLANIMVFPRGDSLFAVRWFQAHVSSCCEHMGF